jgi:hypothetical protein
VDDIQMQVQQGPALVLPESATGSNGVTPVDISAVTQKATEYGNAVMMPRQQDRTGDEPLAHPHVTPADDRPGTRTTMLGEQAAFDRNDVHQPNTESTSPSQVAGEMGPDRQQPADQDSRDGLSARRERDHAEASSVSLVLGRGAITDGAVSPRSRPTVPDQTSNQPGPAATEPSTTVPRQELSGYAPEAIGRPSIHVDVRDGEFGDLRIRVALSQQTVHTNVTTQRVEVGEVLLQRQDQLHTALRSSGLEMGDFRVHVDRHGSSHPGYDRTAAHHHPVSLEPQEHRTASHEQVGPTLWPDAARRLNLFA